MRTMYDSTTAGDIPITAAMVGGYVDGPYAWSAADWDRFPRAVHVRIATRETTDDGHVGDCERGDMDAAGLVRWVLRRRTVGADPTGYCSVGNWAACRQAFTAADVPEPHWWVAAYPGGGAVIPAGAIAHQYSDPPASGGHWDLSVVADYWPGVDTPGGTVTTPNSPADNAVLGYLAGNNRVTMPDGNQRNLFDIGSDLTSRLIAVDAKLTALATREAGDAAATITAISRVGQLDPAVLQHQLEAGLTALGWTPAPTAGQNGTAAAAAVLAAIQAQLAGAQTHVPTAPASTS